MKLKIRNILLAAALVVIIAGVASQIRIRKVSGQAATPDSTAAYTLNIRRSFGYSAGGNIRGSFRLVVNGPQENISKVVFLLDRQPTGEVTEPPFQLDIHTQDYPEGSHTLSAEVTTLDGSVQMAPGGTFNFVSARDQWAGVFSIIVVIGAILLLVVGLGFLFTFLTTGKTVKDLPLGSERHYGIQGGGVCSHCGRPFAFHWWGLNLVGSKYDRCDYCGKWGSYQRLALEELRLAEAAEMQTGSPETGLKPVSPEEKFNQMLDDSRFDPD
jgi:hypothetical protein